MGNNVLACCSVALMVLGICLYMSRNSSRVCMPIVFGFQSCAIVVMPYIYSLSKYFWAFILAIFGRLAYVGLFVHAYSSGVVLMGNARFALVTCNSNSF